MATLYCSLDELTRKLTFIVFRIGLNEIWELHLPESVYLLYNPGMPSTDWGGVIAAQSHIN